MQRRPEMTFPSMMMAVALSVQPSVKPLTAAELTLAEATSEGWRPIASQSFSVVDGERRCSFVSAEKAGAFRAVLRCEERADQVLTPLGTDETFVRVDAVSFNDLDGDQENDIALLVTAKTAAGEAQRLSLFAGSDEGLLERRELAARLVRQVKPLTVPNIRKKLRALNALDGVTKLRTCESFELPVAISEDGVLLPSLRPLPSMKVPAWLTPRAAERLAELQFGCWLSGGENEPAESRDDYPVSCNTDSYVAEANNLLSVVTPVKFKTIGGFAATQGVKPQFDGAVISFSVATTGGAAEVKEVPIGAFRCFESEPTARPFAVVRVGRSIVVMASIDERAAACSDAQWADFVAQSKSFISCHANGYAKSFDVQCNSPSGTVRAVTLPFSR